MALLVRVGPETGMSQYNWLPAWPSNINGWTRGIRSLIDSQERKMCKGKFRILDDVTISGTFLL